MARLFCVCEWPHYFVWADRLLCVGDQMTLCVSGQITLSVTDQITLFLSGQITLCVSGLITLCGWTDYSVWVARLLSV